MRRISTAAVIAGVAAVCLTACGGAVPEEGNTVQTGREEKAAQADFDINAWGDSITQGINGEGTSYPQVLEELTGIHTNNFGYSGDSSEEVLARSLAYGDQSEDVMVMQMGDNGGWDSFDELIAQYRIMIEKGGTDRYIIISSTDDPDDFEQIWGYTYEEIGLEDTWYEAELRKAFGEHLLIGRKYLIRNGLSVNGLRETEEDRTRAKKGSISLQLRNTALDNTHLNAAGYTALAHGVYEKGAELGYWE